MRAPSTPSTEQSLKKMKNTIPTLAGGLLVLGAQFLCAQQPVNPAAPPTAPAAAKVGPRIQFQNPVYDFGRVKSGELVKYTFIFTNTGDALLILDIVQPQCGCTAAGEWSHQVEPNKMGTIPIQFNSATYSGQVLKTVTVTSNDKNQPSVGLQLKGSVWKPIDVQPTFVVLNILPGAQSNVTATVHIVNNMEELITLSPPESNNKGLTADLRTNTLGKDFQVIITAATPFQQPKSQGLITLRTSSTNMPVISFTVLANLQQAGPQISKPVPAPGPSLGSRSPVP